MSNIFQKQNFPKQVVSRCYLPNKKNSIQKTYVNTEESQFVFFFSCFWNKSVQSLVARPTYYVVYRSYLPYIKIRYTVYIQYIRRMYHVPHIQYNTRNTLNFKIAKFSTLQRRGQGALPLALLNTFTAPESNQKGEDWTRSRRVKLIADRVANSTTSRTKFLFSHGFCNEK